MNTKAEPLTTKTVDLPASSTDPLPPTITLERLIQELPKNLSDEAVEDLLDSLHHLEACLCEPTSNKFKDSLNESITCPPNRLILTVMSSTIISPSNPFKPSLPGGIVLHHSGTRPFVFPNIGQYNSPHIGRNVTGGTEEKTHDQTLRQNTATHRSPERKICPCSTAL